ncbi:DUF4255 domain-containing protein [Novosphingobium resinovorum]|uniref:Pvc16 N-terminal domain-containing protein n=1 Tax=Novosphingobium resinovorum TaxID=158500 RepID=A0A031JID7_9SPHN|nr:MULTISPECIES: DUF4255 domain-containing protein [Sphingomonadaceae]AOR79755.1 hypothetical protein BES08_23580 [Novosphingobium resinovorum]EJU10904.1 hypothetical protein LH128_21425 [Sphingomonas sp. LH128]EZP73012.1 hypothetical protein BV97_05023 [Novosphingobium resinovorum]MBF7013267.1 DUF4255 domain-containing protein [Novosphingobium sp. HR1a]WJM25420.1 DUF4255 domain-containing protein [Novosphingobium resinovorum]
MSTPFAIAGVTAVLRQLVVEGLALDKAGDAVGTIGVSAGPPDLVAKPGQPEPTRVNLYLHQVTPNAAWRNLGLPGRDSGGDLVSAPPLAFTLHYLVTTFAAEMFVAEVLLGHTLRILGENAVLTREAVRRALVPTAASPLATALENCGLADQIELVKLTPTAVALEDMSRIWSAFQAHYRTTVAYEASVVLIDPRAKGRTALPATARAVFGETLALPEIARVGLADDPSAAVTTEDTLAIAGLRLLAASGTVVRIGATDHAPASDSRAHILNVDLAAAPRPRAGVQSVTVIHPRQMGDPATAHEGVFSNAAALILRPVVNTVSAANSATRTIDGIVYADGTLTVTAARAIGRDQRVEVLLNERGAPASRPPRGYAIAAPAANGLAESVDEAAQIAIPYRAIARGDYLVRLRIDGAESLLTPGGDGRFATPLVTI